MRDPTTIERTMRWVDYWSRRIASMVGSRRFSHASRPAVAPRTPWTSRSERWISFASFPIGESRRSG